MNQDSIEALRQAQLEKTPRWYNPWLHLTATTGSGLVVLLVALTRIHDLKPLELLVIPIFAFLANGAEWRAHKSWLHKRTWPVYALYDRHTPIHHALYRSDDMAIRDRREFRVVLLPSIGVLAIVVVTAPFAYGLSLLVSDNAGWLVLVTSALYVVSYEVFHLSYHLPIDSFIGRLRLIAILRSHHARHHDPRWMTRYNFNVNVPLWDWIRGTMAPKD
jgi:hypothetical protein